MKLDPSKIKRVFAFGCSFTQFMWPTWADIISHEFKNAEYYNFGLPGIGNLAIAARVSEAQVRYNFTEHDLVMILWSTFLREDRWLRGTWVRTGNVFNPAGFYDDNFIKNYTDICGYLIRDGAIISLTEQMLKTSPCHSFMMKSVPLDYLEKNDLDVFEQEKLQQIYDLYNKIFERMPISLYEFLKKKYNILEWPQSIEYYWDDLKRMHRDSHPLPIDACEYIHNHVLELSPSTLEYSLQNTIKLQMLKSKKEIINEFSHQEKQQNFLF